MRKVNGGRVESCSIVNDGKRRLALDKEEVRRICKNYFEYLYKLDT